jgi:hypothetical protein
MKQITLNIPENKYMFFMDLINNLDFIEITDNQTLSKEDIEFIEGTKSSLKQVEDHQNNAIELKSAEKLLDEL